MMNFSELEYVQDMEQRPPAYSASDESGGSGSNNNNENIQQKANGSSSKQKLVSHMTKQKYKNTAKNKISFGVSDRIAEIRDQRDVHSRGGGGGMQPSPISLSYINNNNNSMNESRAGAGSSNFLSKNSLSNFNSLSNN